MQSNANMTRNIVVNKNDKNIFLKINNYQKNILIKDKIVESLKSKGYSVVDNEKNSTNTLEVNIIFADNIKNAHKLVAAKNDLIEGAKIGLKAGLENAKSLEELALMGAVTALSVGMVSLGIEHSTYRAIVDLSLKSNLQKDTLQKSRIIAEAKRMNLKDSEAFPILEDKTSNLIVNLF